MKLRKYSVEVNRDIEKTEQLQEKIKLTQNVMKMPIKNYM